MRKLLTEINAETERQVEQTKSPDFIDQVIEHVRTSGVGVNLDVWACTREEVDGKCYFDDQPKECGAVACVVGHILLCAGYVYDPGAGRFDADDDADEAALDVLERHYTVDRDALGRRFLLLGHWSSLNPPPEEIERVLREHCK